MAGVDNLIPFNERTESEQREIAKAGGIASGQARREKKQLRNAVETILQMKAPEKIAKKLQMDIGINEDDVDFYAALGFAVINKGLKGDVAAFNAVRDIIGEKPTDSVTVDAKVNNPLAELTTEEIRQLIVDDKHQE